jgi:hypothetical protein
MGVNISAGSIGERIVLAIVVLGMVAELLSDNWEHRPAMTIDECAQLCWSQDTPVHKVEAFACICLTQEPG